MHKKSLSAHLKKPWLFEYLTKADVSSPPEVEHRNVTCSPKHIFVYKHIEGPLADGSAVKEAGDDHLFVRTVFTAAALSQFAQSREDIGDDADDLNFDHSLLLLRKFHLSFKPHEESVKCVFELVVTEFVLWGLLDGFVPKTIPTNCMHIAEIQRRSQILRMQWKEKLQGGDSCEQSSLGSIALSQLLEQMSQVSTNPQQDSNSKADKDADGPDAGNSGDQPTVGVDVNGPALQGSRPQVLTADDFHVRRMLVPASQEKELEGAWDYDSQPSDVSCQPSVSSESQAMAQSPLYSVSPRQPLRQLRKDPSKDFLQDLTTDRKTSSNGANSDVLQKKRDSVTRRSFESRAKSFLDIVESPRSRNKARVEARPPATLDCDINSVEIIENKFSSPVGKREKCADNQLSSIPQNTSDSQGQDTNTSKDKGSISSNNGKQVDTTSVEVQVGSSVASQHDQSPKRAKAVDVFTEIGDSLQLMSQQCIAEPGSLQAEITRDHSLMNGHVDSLIGYCDQEQAPNQTLESTGPFTVQGLTLSQDCTIETAQDTDSRDAERRKNKSGDQTKQQIETDAEAPATGVDQFELRQSLAAEQAMEDAVASQHDNTEQVAQQQQGTTAIHIQQDVNSDKSSHPSANQIQQMSVDAVQSHQVAPAADARENEYSLASLPNVADSMDSLHLSVSLSASQATVEESAEPVVSSAAPLPDATPHSATEEQCKVTSSGLSGGSDGSSSNQPASSSSSNQDAQRLSTSSSLSSPPQETPLSQSPQFKSPPEPRFASTQCDSEASQAPKPDFPVSQVAFDHGCTSDHDDAAAGGNDVRDDDDDDRGDSHSQQNLDVDVDVSPELFASSSSSSGKQSGSSSGGVVSYGSSSDAVDAAVSQAEASAERLPDFSVSPITASKSQTQSQQKICNKVVDFDLDSPSFISETHNRQPTQSSSGAEDLAPSLETAASMQDGVSAKQPQLSEAEKSEAVRDATQREVPDVESMKQLTVVVDDTEQHAFKLVSPPLSAHIVSIVPISPPHCLPSTSGQISPPAPPQLSAQLGNLSAVRPICKDHDGQLVERAAVSRPATTEDCQQVDSPCDEPIIIDVLSIPTASSLPAPTVQEDDLMNVDMRVAEDPVRHRSPSESGACIITSAHVPPSDGNVNPIVVGEDSQLSAEGNESQLSSDPDSLELLQGVEREVLRRETLLLAGEVPNTPGQVQVKREVVSPQPQIRPANIMSRSSSTSSTADSIIEAYTTQRRMEALQRKLDNNKSQPLAKLEPTVFNRQKKQTFVAGKVQIVNNKPPAESGIKLLLGTKKKSLLKKATTGAANKSALQAGKQKRKLYHTESMLLEMDADEEETGKKDRPVSVFAGHHRLKRNESEPALSGSPAAKGGEKPETGGGSLSRVSSEPVVRTAEPSQVQDRTQGTSPGKNGSGVSMLTYYEDDVLTVSDSGNSQDSIIDLTDRGKAQTQSPLTSFSFPPQPDQDNSTQGVSSAVSKPSDLHDVTVLNRSASDSVLVLNRLGGVQENLIVSEKCDTQGVGVRDQVLLDSQSIPAGGGSSCQVLADASSGVQSPVEPQTPTLSRSNTLPVQRPQTTRSPSISSQSSVTSVPVTPNVNSSPPLSRRGSVTKVIFMESPQRVRRPTGNNTPPTDKASLQGTPSVKRKVKKSLKMMTPVARRKTIDSDSVVSSPDSQLLSGSPVKSPNESSSQSVSKPAAQKRDQSSPKSSPDKSLKKKANKSVSESTPKENVRRPKRTAASTSKVKPEDMKMMSPRKKRKIVQGSQSSDKKSTGSAKRPSGLNKSSRLSGDSSSSPVPCYQPVVCSSDSSFLLDDTVTFEDLLGQLDEDLSEDQRHMQQFMCPPVFTNTMLNYFQEDSYLLSTYQ